MVRVATFNVNGLRARIFLLLLSSAIVGCSSAGKAVSKSPNNHWVNVWKAGGTCELSISNPRQWAAAQFLDSPDATVEEAQLSELEADIDHDGTLELFIGSRETAGNAGMCHLAFKKSGSDYHYIGSLFFHPKAFKVLPLGPKGEPMIAIYIRNSGCEGDIVILAHDGNRFVEVSREMIHPGDGGTDEGRERYKEMFGD